MVATASNGDGSILIGAPVHTADGRRLGYVLDGDAYQLEIGDGFIFRRSYRVPLCEVACYEDGALLLKITMDQVEQRQK